MRHFVFGFLITASLGWFSSAACGQEIRIGQPKAWRYDRMFPVEDGLLRDVEGINVSSLTGLDANDPNSRVVDLLQTYVSASVNYDQTAGIQNALAMDAFNATRGSQLNQLKDQATTSQALADQKAQIAKALVQAIADQTKDKQAGCVGKTCDEADKRVKDLNDQLKAIKDASDAVGTTNLSAPTGPSLTGVSGGTPITTPALTPLISGTDFMKNALTSDQKNLVGSLPARERLQSFITLLNDRLTHQLALSLDERGLSKDFVPVVLQLDVAIEPNSNRKNQQAVSRFTLVAGDDCGGRAPIAYNLYPALSAFNVSQVQGQSSGFYANGGFKGLFLGSNISFQRQHDHIQSAMAQSVYMSGFREGDQRFGWYYGPPAYSNIVRPGIYTTFAVVLIPKKVSSDPEEPDAMNVCRIRVDGDAHWQKKNGKADGSADFNALVNPANGPIVPDNNAPLVRQVQYWPHYGPKSDLQKDINVIAIEFEQPVDPNLLISAGGKLLKRVRDWRGRATTPSATDNVNVTDSAGGTHSVSIGRGLLESNYDEADTWIAVSQRRILVKISYSTAGSLDFPSIRLLVPGGDDTDLRDAVDYKTYASRISIGDRTFYACHPKLAAYDPAKGNEGCMQQPNSLWLPLFLEKPEKNHRLRVVKVHAIQGDENTGVALVPPPHYSAPRLINAAFKADEGDTDQGSVAEASLDAPDNSKNGQQQYIYVSLDDGRIKLSAGAQVLLVAPAHSRFAHPIAMECAPLGDGLLCHLHPQTITFSSPQDPNAARPAPTSLQPSTENAGNAAFQASSCLIEQTQRSIPKLSNSTLCDWRNYRLQVVLTQAASEGGIPTILATADFPTTATTLPVIGPARNGQKTHSGSWIFEFPVWYGAAFRAKEVAGAANDRIGTSPGKEGSLCVGDATGEPQNITAKLTSDPSGDAIRGSVLKVTVPNADLSTFVFSAMFLYDHNCALQLGPLSGAGRVVLPDNLLLVRAGTTNNFYQFSGTNTDKVESLSFSDKEKVTPDRVSGGFVADLSVKAAKDVLVYFDLGGLTVPAIACWNTDTSSTQVCGQVVIKATGGGQSVIAPLNIQNQAVPPSTLKAESPSAKISVRPD